MAETKELLIEKSEILKQKIARNESKIVNGGCIKFAKFAEFIRDMKYHRLNENEFVVIQNKANK